MPFDSSFDAKERVRQAVDIVDLVSSYNIQLRREGRGFKALCPWHDDSRPSLQVNPERQSFKCWVCDVGGDVFEFVERIEGVKFPEALAMLAERTGIELRARRESGAGGASAVEDKRPLYQAMAWAEERFHLCLLKAPEAEPARKYLAERGLSAESIRTFRLGYAPDQWDWLLRQAKDTRFTPKTLEAAGLVAPRPSGGGYYDRFKGRVLFSIRDGQGRPVGTGGRVLPGQGDDRTAKYINSPETPLFSKSSLLYGLDLARRSIRLRKTVLVMEGYTDCIVAHQRGFDHAVAVLGTALGEKHARLLRQIEERARVVLVLDGDEAGRKRANEVLQLFVAQQIDLRVLTLPGEKDPCDFLLHDGPQAFEERIDGALDAMTHAITVATTGIDLQRNVAESSRALAQLLELLATAPRLRADTTTEDRLREQKILQRLSREFRVPESDLRSSLTAERRKRQSRRVSPAGASATGTGATASANEADKKIDTWERELLELIVAWPDGANEALDVIREDELSTPAARRIFGACRELVEADTVPTMERLLLMFDHPASRSLLVDLDEGGRRKPAGDPPARLRAFLASFERRRQDRESQVHLDALREGLIDDDGALSMLAATIERERRRQGIDARPLEPSTAPEMDSRDEADYGHYQGGYGRNEAEDE